jgi:uncharacterized lipoprotein YajG
MKRILILLLIFIISGCASKQAVLTSSPVSVFSRLFPSRELHQVIFIKKVRGNDGRQQSLVEDAKTGERFVVSGDYGYEKERFNIAY